MRTALYMRVSTEDQAKEGYSLPSQKRKLLAFCESHDWPVVAVYADEGLSGSSLAARPQATQMIEDAKAHKFDNILILKVDRLCRKTKDLLTIVDVLKKAKVHLNAVEETIDYDTPTGQMMLTILGSFAELERSTITQRTNAGKEQKRLQGYKVAGGFIPYAYDFIDGKYVCNENRTTVETIFRLFIEGMSANAICSYLQANKVLSPRGSKTWERATVLRILRNESYIGFIRGKKAENIEAAISEDDFRLVQTILSQRTGTTRYAKDDFIFADVAYCGVCGRKLFCKREVKPRERKYYVCTYNSSKHLHANDDGAHSSRMENHIFEELFLSFFNSFRLSLDSIEVKADDSKVKSLNKALEGIDKRKEIILKRKNKLMEKYLDEVIKEDEYQSLSANIQKELADLDTEKDIFTKQKDELENSTSNKNFVQKLIETKNKLHEFWPTMNDKQKRLFISSTIKKILVIKGRIVSIDFI